VETQANAWANGQSRRSILLKVVSFGGAAVGMMAANLARAQTKLSKTLVGYQDTPKGTQNCAGCALFLAPNACQNVDGDVSPQGWCKIWRGKPS